MTLAEYIEEIRDGLREITPAFFTNAELMRYINRKELEFARKTKWLTTELDIAWETDGYSVLLPSDFIAVDFVLLFGENSTDYLEKRGGRARADTSEMDPGYRLDKPNNKIILTDETDMSDGSTLRLSYIQKPTPYTDEVADLAVESDLGDEFAEVIINGVISLGLVKQERFNSANYHEAAFKTGVVEAKRYRNEREGKNVRNIEH